MQIVILSDTHGTIHKGAWPHIEAADEVWHAGDFGPPDFIDALASRCKSLKAVSGNADPKETLYKLKETELFIRNQRRIMLHHIVGRPGKYVPEAKAIIAKHQPDIIVCGHSHILLVAPVRDGAKMRLHINPGAAGHHGLHSLCTMIRITIGANKIENAEVIELGRRGRIFE